MKAIAVGTATITCTANDESGVSATCEVTVKPVVPVSIALPTNMSVVVGETITLKPEIVPVNAVTVLTWTSDDETIARVNAKGEVLGVKVGQTFINVTTDNGQSGWCKLTVTKPEVTKVTIPEKETVHEGETVMLTVTLLPEGAESTVSWMSDDETVAKVNAKGEVIGVKEGLAIIYATAANGIRSNACKLKVDAPVGIYDVQAAKETGTSIYTISGQRLQKPRKGVNIIGGKAVIVK